MTPIRHRYRAFPLSLGRAVDVCMSNDPQEVQGFAVEAACRWGVRYGVYDHTTLVEVVYPTLTSGINPLRVADLARMQGIDTQDN